MIVITVDDAHRQMRAQEMPERQHIAFVCPICGTTQSMHSLIAAGVPADKAENYIGFSCVGRWTDAGPAKKRAPGAVGCDWTLGGLFRLHEVEVETPDGKRQPSFRIATPEEAAALHSANTTPPAPALAKS